METSENNYRFDCSFIRFQYETGIEVVFDGDESRKQVAWDVVEHRESISKQAIHLLVSFMKDSGVFDLGSIEVFAEETSEWGDFALHYTFTADRDPQEYGYTYFEVYFRCHEPPSEPFWPFKFIVGFH